MNKLFSNKKQTFLFMAICVWTMLLMVCTVTFCKKTIHFDELFSYGSSNTPFEHWILPGDREWRNSKEMFRDYLSADGEERFDYQMVWSNQGEDVHPPLYYAVIHTICSLMPGRFSVWVAVCVNIFFLILTLPALYLISKKIFKNNTLALTVCFCFVTSNLTSSIVTFLRMYVMLFCITTWLTYFHIRWLENTKDHKYQVLIFITTILGALTHYYFLVFLFFMAIGCCGSLLVDKKYKEFFFYCASMAVAGIFFVFIYPASIRHIFHGYRGDEAFHNIKTLEGYFQVLLSYLQQLGRGIVRIDWGIIIVIGLIAVPTLYALFKRGVFEEEDGRRSFGLIIFTLVGYFLVITKISAMFISRYLSPLFPLIYLSLLGGIYLIFNQRINKKIGPLVLAIIAVGLFNWKSWGGDNLSTQTKIARQYAGYDCLVMVNGEDWLKSYNVINSYSQLIEYDELYFVSMPYEDDFKDEKLLLEEKMIVYIDDQDDIANDQELLLSALPQMTGFEHLYDDSGSKVYLTSFED